MVVVVVVVVLEVRLVVLDLGVVVVLEVRLVVLDSVAVAVVAAADCCRRLRLSQNQIL